MVSDATAGKSPAAANREAVGNIAVANETVIKECGRIHIAYALLYAVSPAPLPPTVALLASLLTTTSATWVTSTKPRVHLANRNVLPRPVCRKSKRGRKR